MYAVVVGSVHLVEATTFLLCLLLIAPITACYIGSVS